MLLRFNMNYNVSKIEKVQLSTKNTFQTLILKKQLKTNTRIRVILFPLSF